MAKRGNGEGSKPRKRPDGRWEARYTDANNKRRSVYGSTRKEVASKLVEALAHKDDAPVFVPADITVREFFNEYEDVAIDTMKRRSFETYQSIAKVHLLPAFGSTKLKTLNRGQVQRMYTRKRKDGLSPARIRRIHGALSAALNTAVRWHYLEHNICKEVSPPRVPPPEIRPFSLDEAKVFLKASESDRYHALYVLGLTSGARWGELAGLFWSDLDLTTGTMHIQRALIRSTGGYSFDSPKTKGSRRSVALTVKATEALTSHRERQRATGMAVEGDGLVFTTSTGAPIHSSNFIRRSFKPLLKRANLPDTNWHSATRHTCTCLLLLDRVDPKSVANQMGWSSMAFMLENYARFLPHWNDTGAMDEALG